MEHGLSASQIHAMRRAARPLYVNVHIVSSVKKLDTKGGARKVSEKEKEPDHWNLLLTLW